MKVKMLRSVGSTNGVHQPGSIVELNKATAESWIKAGLAEEFVEPTKVNTTKETKVIEPSEKKEKPSTKNKEDAAE